MEFIDMRFIMNRLLDNPVMAKLKLSSAATYVKDFSSINGIDPIIDYGYTYLKVINYMAEMPPYTGHIEDMYLCGYEISPIFTPNDRLVATLKTSKVPSRDKSEYGNYKVRGNFIFTDIESGIFEIYHSILRVDELGFPMLPYHGSLMEAVMNYIKYKYYTILWENDIISKNKVDAAHSEYTWYIAQYTSEEGIPTHDEAVAWAHSWQRLLNTRNEDLDDKSLVQTFKV